MNLKKTLLSFLAVATMMFAGMAPVVSAADQSASTSGTVTINNTGTFSPYFCNALLLPTVAASTSAQTTSGQIGICFTDTISWRGGFTGSISSSDWIAGPTRVIPKDAMKIDSVTGVGQQRWSSDGLIPQCIGAPVWGTTRPCIADIGAMTPSTSYNGSPLTTATWTGDNFGTSNLSVTESRYEGRGTIHSSQGLNVTMTIPANQAAGTYVSTLTYEVVYTDGQP